MKKMVLLVIAGTAILFGLYGLAGSLTAKPTEPVSAKVEEPTINVWKFSHSAQVGQELERSDVELVNLPESQANRLGVSEDMEFKFEKGAVYVDAVNGGDVAFPEHWINPSQDGYVDMIISPNRVPYAIKVQPEAIVGGVISHGSKVDVLALSLPTQFSIETAETEGNRKRNMFVTPVLTGVKVLQVNKNAVEATRNSPALTEVNLILELTRKQVATLTVAKRISELEVHKSIGQYQQSDLHADAGDVLSNFKSIVEFRADTVTVN